jgi:hypothetical protein
MRNVSDQSCRENKKHSFYALSLSLSLSLSNRALYVIMWKHAVEQDRPQITIWHKHIACWIPKAINTHTQVVK